MKQLSLKGKCAVPQTLCLPYVIIVNLSLLIGNKETFRLILIHLKFL